MSEIRDTGILKPLMPEMPEYFGYLHLLSTPPAYRLGNRCGVWVIPREVALYRHTDKFGTWQSEIGIAMIHSLGDIELPVITWAYFPSGSSGIATSVETAELSILECHKIKLESL